MYHADRLDVRAMTEYTRGYEKICEVTATPVHKPLSGYIRENNWDVTKLICFARPEHVEKLLVSYGEKFGKDISYSSSNATFFEVLNRGASKGNAVKSVAEEKGIPPEDVMAFGDALNDVSMLEYAGLSFAMANGDPRVKEAAKEVCPSNDDDGVARMIEKYCL
jgi:Cof subfamily protein (haloacid dehalogenase superfamily)